MYEYRYRAESDSTLIEFLDAEAPSFVGDLLSALASVQPRMKLAEAPAMDDEYVMEMVTTVGTFSFHKDAWGQAFILDRGNPDGLAQLEALLSAAAAFHR